MKARKSFCLGRHFHGSISEADYCNWLFARVQLGEILSFRVWPSIYLHTINKIWKIDFEVLEKDGSYSYHESKGWNRSDDSFKFKRDAFRICYPNMKLYINKRLWTGKPDKKTMKWTAAAVARRNSKIKANQKRINKFMSQKKRGVIL